MSCSAPALLSRCEGNRLAPLGGTCSTPAIVWQQFGQRGYNGFAAAITHALEKVFETQQLQLTVISTAVPDVRHYDTGGAGSARTSSTAECGWESTSDSQTSPAETWGYS